MSRVTACILSFVAGVVLTLGATYKAPTTEAPKPDKTNGACTVQESFSEPLADCEYRLQDCVAVVEHVVASFTECVDEVEQNTKRLTDAVRVTEDCMYQLRKCKSK